MNFPPNSCIPFLAWCQDFDASSSVIYNLYAVQRVPTRGIGAGDILGGLGACAPTPEICKTRVSGISCTLEGYLQSSKSNN
jgi:hypothetical protein